MVLQRAGAQRAGPSGLVLSAYGDAGYADPLPFQLKVKVARRSGAARARDAHEEVRVEFW